jgi:hypothetical protein
MVVTVVVLAAGASALLVTGRDGGATSAPSVVPAAQPGDSAVRAPAGARIRVRVLNASTRSGLARRASLYLRDLGYDVVDWGTDPVPRPATLIEDHGHPDWATRIARALGGADVVPRRDSLRQLDLTVRLGRDWRAPAQFFRP